MVYVVRNVLNTSYKLPRAKKCLFENDEYVATLYIIYGHDIEIQTLLMITLYE